MASSRPARQRLDQLLLERGLVESREKAQILIRSGQVRVGGELADKPGSLWLPDAELQVQKMSPFVSRGAEKLEGALGEFALTVAGRVCLDGGISTGGFTDCLLQRGAARVYGIDVGYGQVAWKLRNDPRVILKERTNLRHLQPEALYSATDPRPDLATVDVSFISLRLILPALKALLVAPRELLLLVKPQFEAGKGRVGKNGVVRDGAIHREVIVQVWEAAQSLGWRFLGLTGSPITGPAGNHEYWLWLSETGGGELPAEHVAEVVVRTLRAG